MAKPTKRKPHIPLKTVWTGPWMSEKAAGFQRKSCRTAARDHFKNEKRVWHPKCRAVGAVSRLPHTENKTVQITTLVIGNICSVVPLKCFRVNQN